MSGVRVALVYGGIPVVKSLKLTSLMSKSVYFPVRPKADYRTENT
jgi:hypothetical protein